MAVLVCAAAAASLRRQRGGLGCHTAGSIRFQEVAAKSGLHFQLNNGATGRFRQVELMTGGVAAFDYNNDGCADIYFANGAALPSLEKTRPNSTTASIATTAT